MEGEGEREGEGREGRRECNTRIKRGLGRDGQKPL